MVVQQNWKHSARFPETNSICAQETADMTGTVSTSGYGIAEKDLAARALRGAGNAVPNTRRMWTLDDLDSGAAVKMLGCKSLYLFFPEMSRITDNRNIGLHTLCSSKDILYREISIDNVCFIMDGVKVVCKLIDFDHASVPGQRSFGAEIWSGTMPFVAYEVLDQSTNGYMHRLHHDLESVLYMCVWHAFGYTLKNVPRDKQPLNGWRSGSWDSIFLHKYMFLTDPHRAKNTIGAISDGTHRYKCFQLRTAFEVAFVKNDTELRNYMTDLLDVHMDMQAAWEEENAEPSKYAVYATFPAIMKELGEEAKACTEDCCVQTTS